MIEKGMWRNGLKKKPKLEGSIQAYLRGNVCMMVCIYGKGTCGIYGEIIDFCQKDPEDFAGSSEAVLKISSMYFRLNESVKNRSPFFTEPEGRKKPITAKEQPAPFPNSFLEEMEWTFYPRIHKIKKILTVMVIGQPDENLWGVVRGRLPENRYMVFHSSSELLELLDKTEV